MFDEINNKRVTVFSQVQELCQHGKAGEIEIREVFAGIEDAMLDAFGIKADAIVLIQPGSLPKTTSRKICRQQARALFLREELRTVASWKRWESQA